MAISRASSSSIINGSPKYQRALDSSLILGPGGISTTGLHSWYDAADSSTIISSSGSVSQWNDKSGNVRHASQSVSAKRPTTGATTQNGKNVISFNGTTQYFNATATITANQLTLFSVYRRDSGNTYGRIFSLFRTSQNDYDNTDAIEVHTSAVSFGGVTPPFTGGYRATAHIAGSTISYGTPYLFSATLDGASWSQNNSGTIITGTTSSTPLNVNRNTVGAGSDSGGGDAYFTGWFAEQIIYTRVLTAGEISTVRSYLSSKWGV